MPDNSYTKYQALLDSISVLPLVEEQNEKDRANMESFKEYLAYNWETLLKFGKAYGEVVSYLDAFSFDKSEPFPSVQKKLENMVSFDNYLYNNQMVISKYKKVGTKVESYREYFSLYQSMPAEEMIKDVKELIRVCSVERNNILKSAPKMWEEDKERLQKASDFVISIPEGMNEACAKREKNIQNTLDKYKWLKRGDDKKFHDGLISKDIYFSEYQSEINKRKEKRDARLKERRKIIWEGIGVFLAIAVLIVVFLTVVIFDTFDFELWWIFRIPIGIIIVGSVIGLINAFTDSL